MSDATLIVYATPLMRRLLPPLVALEAFFRALRKPKPVPAVEPAPEPEPDARAYPPSTVSAVRPSDIPKGEEPLVRETCGSCRFFERHTSKAGQCRRAAPDFGTTAMGEWPIVPDHEWCGTFVPAVPPEMH